MDVDLKLFGSWLKQNIDAKQINAADLARDIGVNDSTISRILGGKARPTPATLEKIAIRLNLNFSDLLVRAGYPEITRIDTSHSLTQEQRDVIGDKEVFGLARKITGMSDHQRKMVETYIDFIEEKAKHDANDKKDIKVKRTTV